MIDRQWYCGEGEGHASKGQYENLSGPYKYKCYYCTKLKTLTKMDNLSWHIQIHINVMFLIHYI